MEKSWPSPAKVPGEGARLQPVPDSVPVGWQFFQPGRRGQLFGSTSYIIKV